jgi:hypothetical protein
MKTSQTPENLKVIGIILLENYSFKTGGELFDKKKPNF